MEMKLTGKTALVTGSTKGIDRAIAEELAKEGVHVIVNGRNQSDTAAVVEELKKAFQKQNLDLLHMT